MEESSEAFAEEAKNSRLPDVKGVKISSKNVNSYIMFKGNWGRIFITFIIVSSTLISVIVDWNDTHLFNPEWPGHARYHGLLFLNLLCGASVLGLWLMWRPSKEPELGVRVAVLITIIYRASFFYLGFLPPHTEILPEHEEPPHFDGFPIYLNVVASGVFVLLILLGYWIYRREQLNAQG